MNSRGELGNLPPGVPPTEAQQQLHPDATVHQQNQNFNRSPGNNATTQAQTTSASTAATSTSADPLEPWRIDLTQNSRTGTPRSSTPQEPPQGFTERRSPPGTTNTTTDVEQEDDQPFKTPSGATLASRNAQNQNTSVILAGDITKDLTLEQLVTFTQVLEENIEDFGSTFRNQVGWKRRLNPHIANLTESLRKLISNAKRLQATRELKKLYPLETTLNEYAENLRRIADAETEAEGSPFVFNPSVLVTPATPATQLTHHQSLENLGRQGSIVEDAAQSENEDFNRTHTSRSPQNLAIRTIDMKVKSLEVRKADMTHLDQVVQALDSKASKVELSDACMRICNLESKITQIDDLQSDLNNLQNGINEDKNDTKVLIDGLCRDGSNQETKLEEALEAIATLRSEIDQLKGQANQSRATSSDTTSHHGLSGFHNGVPVYRTNRQPSVSGISAYPTQAITTAVNTITPGYTHTSFVITSGTRPTSCIAPTAFPPPQITLPQTLPPTSQQYQPYVPQPGTQPYVQQPGTQPNQYLQPPPGFTLVPVTNHNTAQPPTTEAYQRRRTVHQQRGQQSQQ
jgi:hypothetical protein